MTSGNDFLIFRGSDDQDEWDKAGWTPGWKCYSSSVLMGGPDLA